MKPILLATDGSPSATEATREAIQLAAALNVPLVAVAVEHVSAPTYGYFGYAEIHSEMTKIEHEHVARLLEDTAAKADESGVSCYTIAATGPIVDQICRLAIERDAQLVVIGAHGWGTFRRLFFGSVSLGVLHEAPCPVLIAKAPAEAELFKTESRTTAAI